MSVPAFRPWSRHARFTAGPSTPTVWSLPAACATRRVLSSASGSPSSRIGYPSGSTGAEKLFARYLTDSGVFERGQQPIEVLADDVDVELTQAAQAFLRRELVRLEMTIETNPSSNLSIGDLGDIAEHPLFRMAPLVPDGPHPALLVTVNTDDLLTFATSLADEFAHLRFALERFPGGERDNPRRSARASTGPSPSSFSGGSHALRAAGPIYATGLNPGFVVGGLGRTARASPVP